jgi:hypothetical protein
VRGIRVLAPAVGMALAGGLSIGVWAQSWSPSASVKSDLSLPTCPAPGTTVASPAPTAPREDDPKCQVGGSFAPVDVARE